MVYVVGIDRMALHINFVLEGSRRDFRSEIFQNKFKIESEEMYIKMFTKDCLVDEKQNKIQIKGEEVNG